jgi:hypothetical protein
MCEWQQPSRGRPECWRSTESTAPRGARRCGSLKCLGWPSIRPGPRGSPLVDQVHTVNVGRIATLYFQMDGVTFADPADPVDTRMIYGADGRRAAPGSAAAGGARPVHRHVRSTPRMPDGAIPASCVRSSPGAESPWLNVHNGVDNWQ